MDWGRGGERSMWGSKEGRLSIVLERNLDGGGGLWSSWQKRVG